MSFADIMHAVLGRRPGEAAGSTSPTVVPGIPIDVAAILEQKAQHTNEHLDWQHSIVDLLKLLGLDSSETAREELAHELGHSGAVDHTTPAMNTWLHEEIMTKLAEHGGAIP